MSTIGNAVALVKKDVVTQVDEKKRLALGDCTQTLVVGG